MKPKKKKSSVIYNMGIYKDHNDYWDKEYPKNHFKKIATDEKHSVEFKITTDGKGIFTYNFGFTDKELYKILLYVHKLLLIRHWLEE